MQQSNYQPLLPFTPMSGTKFNQVPQATPELRARPDAFNANHHSPTTFLETAQKQRADAAEALDAVTTALYANRSKSTATSQQLPITTPVNNYRRLTPGHFLLPSYAQPHSQAPPPPLSVQPRVLALDSPQFFPSSSSQLVENLTATLKVLSTPSSDPTTTGKRSAFSFGTPLPSPSNTKTTTPANGGGGSSATSRKLMDVQRLHAQLLAECKETETATARAVHDRKQAEKDVEAAAQRLREMEVTLKLKEKRVRELKEVEQQLAEATADAAAECDRAAAAREAAQEATRKLEDVERQVHAARAELTALEQHIAAGQETSLEAQKTEILYQNLQKQVDEASDRLKSLLQRLNAAERDVSAANEQCTSTAAALEALETQLSERLTELATVEALGAEAETLLEEKEARAAGAHREWEAAEEKLSLMDSELVEVSARLDAKRKILRDTEERCGALERDLCASMTATETATAAQAVAEQHLFEIQLQIEAAQRSEAAAFDAAEEAEARAAVAHQLAAYEESRVEAAAAAAAVMEERCSDAHVDERRVLALRAEAGELQTVCLLKAQIEELREERDALMEALDGAKDFGTAAADEVQRAQQQGDDMEAHFQHVVAALETQLNVAHAEVHHERAAKEAAQQRACCAEAGLAQAGNEVSRLTHAHGSINDARLLQAELFETQAQLTAAAEAAKIAAHRATVAEQQVVAADEQVTRAIEERDAVVDRAAATAAARDAAVQEISELRKEAAHKDARHEELVEHVDQMQRVMRGLKQDRVEAQALTATLQLQVDGLRDRLRAETGRRIVMNESSRNVSKVAPSKTKEDGEAVAQHQLKKIDRLVAQNSTLKMTAVRLSKALAVALQQQQNGKENGDEGGVLISAVHGKVHGGGDVADGDTLSDVLGQLQEVQNLLGL